MQEQINALQDQVKKLEEQNRQLSETVNTMADLFYRFVQIDKYYLDNDVEITGSLTMNKSFVLKDGVNVQAGTTTGTQIGTATTQKLAFYGKTPVIQQSAITSPSGGATIDSESRTAITAMLAVFVALGLTA